ncbi:hypothetical protein J6590_105731, partial [Homalodisca vitripennis]
MAMLLKEIRAVEARILGKRLERYYRRECFRLEITMTRGTGKLLDEFLKVLMLNDGVEKYRCSERSRKTNTTIIAQSGA